jgi:parvulin-like peptidyl-prolyl isomerase
MKAATRILLAAASMAAMVGSIAGSAKELARGIDMPGSIALVSGQQRHVPSRRGRGFAHVKRMAKKRRNVLRNRRAHRG